MTAGGFSLRRGIALLAALLLWTGCAREEPSDLPEGKGGGGAFRVVLPGEPRSLDPNSPGNETAQIVAANLYDKLVALDTDSRFLPDLAQSWTVSEDGLAYTFALRENVLWHDGQPFTAADVRWTLEHLKARPSFAAEGLRRITAIETPDDHTVVVRLAEPWAPLLTVLAWEGAFILPRHLGASPARPVGTGPFRFQSWDRGRSLTLEANPEFFKPGPYLDRVVYSFADSDRALDLLLSGKADYMVIRPSLDRLPALAVDPRVRVLTSPADSRYYLAFNLRRPLFRDHRLREAINRALDRPALLERALHGYGAPGYGFYTPAVAWAYNAKALAPAFDPGGARKLLAAVLEGRAGAFEPVLLSAGIVPYGDMAREVTRQLRAVGIAVRLELEPPDRWFERAVERHDFDIVLLGGSQGPDPESLNLRFGSRGLSQIMGYESAELDAAVGEGGRQTDPSLRARAYFRAQEILARDLPIAPLAESIRVVVCRRGVTGLPQVEGRGLVPSHDYSLVRLGSPPGGGR
ncbi:MAG TPA: ABC transporter substrate-binding protein [Thermoanaerobaculia bacterium]|nr:ABC transporter substrate-binding protein [Thermoanaerobaculia bacterium]